MNNSMWDFAIIETLHILGLTVLLGALIVVDFRLLGFGMRSQTVAQLSKGLEPLTWGALLTMAITGISMFMSEAERLGGSTPFFYKMLLLTVALTLHFTIHRRVTQDRYSKEPWLGRMSACLSLVCWLAIATAGRVIAFVK